MKIKLFGLAEAKFFRFHRMFKNKGEEGVLVNSLDPQLGIACYRSPEVF